MQGDIYTAPPNILNYLGARCFIGGTCIATGFCNGGCLLSVAVTRRPVGPWLPYAVGGDVVQHACAVLVHGIVSTAHPGHRRACLCSWRKLKCGIRVQVYPDRREHVVSPRRADAVHVHYLAWHRSRIHPTRSSWTRHTVRWRCMRTLVPAYREWWRTHLDEDIMPQG